MMITMKRSVLQKLLRFFLILLLSAFLGTWFIVFSKNIGNGTRASLQSTENGNNVDRNNIYGNENAKTRDISVQSFDGKDVVDVSNSEIQSLPLDVYIIEEHHEALPYWFGAAYNGTIPKTGNTLIHIDGHSDLSLPMYFRGYPSFRWPAQDQIGLLMQRNDAFIQSSVMADLVTRMIWIWPEWDRKNHENDYAMSSMKLGWTLAKNTKSNRIEKTFCMCIETECMHFTNGVIEMVAPKACITRKTILFEEMNEARAEIVLKQKNWLKENESVILDIDEDFFGCSYVIKPLLDANVSENSLQLLDEYLKRIVCPRTTFHETKTNMVLLDTVSLLITQKTCQFNLQTTSKCNVSELNLNAGKYLTEILTNAHNRNETNLCLEKGNLNTIKTFIKGFINILSKFSIDQLRIVSKIGFCSRTTTKTQDLYGFPEFRICYGANTPFNSVITEFNPTLDDVKKRSKIFEKIIQNTRKYSPKFVTLCRSMRDGYTPRQYFTLIENKIVNTLKETFGNVNLHYDEDLMDGKSGRGFDMFVPD